MVDIPREGVARQKRIRRTIYTIVGGVVVGLVFLGVSRLKPRAPSVERATVWVDTVKRGSMVRQVRGLGTLVPEDIRWIPASTEGRVERRLVQPGTTVTPDTVILELSNQELQRTLTDAELALKAAEAEYTNQKVQLQSSVLTQQAGAATVEAEYQQARLQSEADTELNKQGLVSDLTLKISRSRAEELRNRTEIERKRLAIAADAVKAQLLARQAAVDQARAVYQLRRQQYDQLRVRAGMFGVLQVVPVEIGARVTPGTNLARVANPTKLKAELRVAETQARDVEVGQLAAIDTRNGIIPGRVSRIDPAAQNGTVAVDVALEGALPKGARPDLSVDGTVELERLENVIYVGRPAFGQENSVVSLFKLESDGRTAVRVRVRLGRSSVNTIEILEGLQPNDQVVLSDMSAWDAFDRVELN